MKNKIFYLFLLLSACHSLSAQDLNWATSGYPSGSGTLFYNFGSIGNPASAVTLTISAGPPAFDANPAVVSLNPDGTAYDCTNCGLKTGVAFTNYTGKRTFTFTFAPAVSGLSFNLYDIDGDSAVVSATGPGGPNNITIVPLGTSKVKIDGNNSTAASVTGNNTTLPVYSNQNANPNAVSFSGPVSTLTISYYMHQRDPGFPGTPSFSIGNMSWPIVVPIKWVSFSGKTLSNQFNELKWITDNEENVSRYTVERSKDGQLYKAIGELLPRSNGNNILTTYMYTDDEAGAGISFYRIKQVDIDTRFEYSSVVALSSDKSNDPGITVFPNPADQFVFIINKDNTAIEQTIVFDIYGKIVFQKNGSASKVDISVFPSGLYNIKAINKKGEISITRFIKK